MNENSDDSQSKNKYSCINSIFTSCFGKKCSKKKNLSDQNSELNHILKEKKDFLQMKTQTKDLINLETNFKNSTSIKISTTRLKNKENQQGNNIKQDLIVPKVKKRCLEKSKSKLFCLFCGYNCQNQNNINYISNKKFFHEFKDKLRCFFCGGRNCKHENYLNNISNNNAIDGLNSNFITDNIIASQRPSAILIDKYKLVSKFKELNIGLIVNLQREGEHPYCGPNAYNLTSAGYSYNTSVFTADDIKVKLSGWKDMSVPSSMNYMLEIVKEMSIVTIDKKGKVLVHCHAGYGRTGVVIVCYLLFVSIKDCDTIIKEVKSKRKKCVETKDQIQYCKKFEKFLNHCRIVFGEKENINVYLKKQEDLLFGEELNKYGFIPKLIVNVLEKISILKKKYNLDNLMIYKFFQGDLIDWNDELENILRAMKKMIDKNNWKLFEETENLMILIELLFDWFEDCVEYVISPERTENIILNDIYHEYISQNSFITGIITNDNLKIKEFFDMITNEYKCFEYEVLFYFASFLLNFPPTGIEEEGNFNKMIERLSVELLGFSFCEKNDNEKYNEVIYPLITGLSTIIKSIYHYLKINDNNECDESLSIICPKRKNIPIEYSYTNNDSSQIKPVPRKRKSMFVKTNFKILKNSNISKSDFSPPNNIHRQKTGNTAKFLFHNSINNEAKLKQVYDILSQHFSTEKNNSHITNEAISGFSIDSLTPEKTITRKSKQIEEVIEEILNKGSGTSSCSSSSIEVNLINSKKNKKQIFKSELSPITNFIKKKNNDITKNNYIQKEDKKSIVRKAIDNIKPLNIFSKSKSTLFDDNNYDKNIPKNKNNKFRKSIIEKLRFFNTRNSDLTKKVRKKGLDMSKCKNKSDKALIDLMKYMNGMQKKIVE